jgi:hypothetical protein
MFFWAIFGDDIASTPIGMVYLHNLQEDKQSE